ncbi:hypothetical protein HOF65_07960 [bacterium]|nr:hypothetical protein [bacterium]MBT3853826.1 hypothetical protein [bacterium]MBT4632630.1 hypothetical protein [bacterium]MBT6778987.1 hypothetical protein [bacterium]
MIQFLIFLSTSSSSLTDSFSDTFSVSSSLFQLQIFINKSRFSNSFSINTISTFSIHLYLF